MPLPEGWELLGTICCDVWRVEFIDQKNFNKGDVLPINHKKYQHNPPFKGKVNPGLWSIKNRYHFIQDETKKEGEYPMWVELTRKL